MRTECSATLFDFAPVDGRTVVAGFDGGTMTSDAGALLLGATDQVIGLTQGFAACFRDARNPAFIEHDVATLVGQRIIGIALGYEDLIDHDQLRHDPVMAVLAGQLEARRSDGAPLAGKSKLNRLRNRPVRRARKARHAVFFQPACRDRYFLSIPVFIAQADGILTEITPVGSALLKEREGQGELQASKALREKLGTNQEGLGPDRPGSLSAPAGFYEERGRVG